MSVCESIPELIKRIAIKDQVAFRQFYNLFSRRIFSFVRHHLHCDELAREVVVDTLWDVWRCAQTFSNQSKPEVWVLGIARHKLLDKLDKERRHQIDHIEEIENWESGLSHGEDCSNEREREDLRKGMHLCIEKLSPMHRECLTLVHFDQLSIAEASAVLEIPEGTIKTRIHHAKQKLKSCVAKLRELL